MADNNEFRVSDIPPGTAQLIGGVAVYKEFPERSHYTLGQDGWEGVADFALDWAITNAMAPSQGQPVAGS